MCAAPAHTHAHSLMHHVMIRPQHLLDYPCTTDTQNISIGAWVVRSVITSKLQTYIWFRELVLPGFSCNVCSLQYFYAFQARSAVRQRSLGTQGSNPKKAQKAQDLCFLVWWLSHFLLFCRYLRIHVDLETVNLSCQEAPVVGRVVGGSFCGVYPLWVIAFM